MLPDKKELISAIIDFYDEVERSKTETPVVVAKADIIELSTMDKHFIEIGRKAVLEDAIHSWHNVTEYNGELQTFDSWLEHYLGDIPSWMSLDTFLSVYDEDLRAMYDADVEEAHERNRKLIETAQEIEGDDD